MPSLSSLSDSQGHIQLPPLNDLHRPSMSPTIRYNPYDDRDRAKAMSLSTRDRMERPRSPPPKSGRMWPEPLGIAALVSAAERERERQGIPA